MRNVIDIVFPVVPRFAVRRAAHALDQVGGGINHGDRRELVVGQMIPRVLAGAVRPGVLPEQNGIILVRK
jgi:hypothetical protein